MDQKTRRISRRACLIAIITGALGFFFRLLLYTVAMDEKNMLVTWHPFTVGLSLMALAVLAGGGISALDLPGKRKCSGPVGKIPAAGSFLLALSLVPMIFESRKIGVSVGVLILAGLAAAGLILAGISQLRGRQPYFLTYGILCVFLAAYLVTRYRTWSHDPQLMDYIFAQVGFVVMMLYAYQMTAACLSQATQRCWLLMGSFGIFLCLVGASGGEAVSLCLGGAAWMITGLLSGVGEEQKSEC